MQNKVYHFISHTHWDREWYHNFEEFRFILVGLIDELLSIFKTNSEYHYFHLDGQTILLEDYLEIRPENQKKIETLVTNGKLFIGPWYVLPDEFLVSGEATIRNLLMGHKVGKRFGGIMKVGYLPDSFGHIAQLPQVLRGFDIDNVILWRGFGGEPGQESSEYRWIGPDGSEILMIHLPSKGYGYAYIDTTESSKLIEKGVKLQNILSPRALTSHLLCMNGGDHLWPYRNLPEALKFLNENLPGEFVHSNLVNYVNAVKKEDKTFPSVRGEHHFGFRHAFTLQGVYSTRMYLKQMNEQCQTTLTRYAEPLNVLAKYQGLKSQNAFLNQAWKYLLQNHPHDSICGCSIDSVHEEMVTRFQKCLQISQSVINEAVDFLIPDSEDGEDFVFVFNPSPWPRTEVVECQVEFPRQTVHIGLSSHNESEMEETESSIPGFKIVDAEGNEVRFQTLNRERGYSIRYHRYAHPEQIPVDRFKLLIEAVDVPPLGFKRFKIIPQGEMLDFGEDVQVGRFYLENRYLRAEISERGVVKLVDKINERSYDDLNLFENSGDVGDEYNYSCPEKDEVYYSRAFLPRLSVVESGPLRGAIRIRCRMKIPCSATADEKSRSDKKNVLRLSSIVYLDCHSRRLNFVTTVNNTIKDHRLRVLFQTGAKTDVSHADSQFCVIPRKHKKYRPKDFPLEIPTVTHPMQRFVAVNDQSHGLALIAKGLPEYELKLDGKGTLALTLLRCVGKLSGSNLITRPGGHAGPEMNTPGAQCPGIYTFHYAIFPCGAKDFLKFYPLNQEAENHNLKLLAFQKRTQAESEPEDAFLQVEPASLVMSALKETEEGEGFLLRLYNPTANTIDGKITFNSLIKEAYFTRLDEEVVDRIELENERSIRVLAEAFKIISIKIVLA